jgi:predicted DNA-binding WGR domain protein
MADIRALWWEQHCRNGRSNKVYRTVLLDRAVLAQYGAGGADGQFKRYPFETYEAAAAKAKSLARDKDAKGYEISRMPVEVDVPASLIEKVTGGGAWQDAAHQIITSLPDTTRRLPE